MADEHVVLNLYSFTHKRMARNFAAFSHTRILLDFNESAYLGFIADFAAVQIDELGEPDVLAELYTRRDADEFVHNCTNSPRWRTDFSAASSNRTTCSPFMPSLNGVLFSSMHFRKYAVSAPKASICSTCGAHISPDR